MTIKNESFDLVIDKSTIDSLKCSENFHFGVEQYLKEVSRVLKHDKGVFVCISYGVPYVMLKYLNEPHLKWKVDIRKVPKLQKKETSSQEILKKGISDIFMLHEVVDS